MRERDLSIDHTTIFLLVQSYAPEIKERSPKIENLPSALLIEAQPEAYRALMTS